MGLPAKDSEVFFGGEKKGAVEYVLIRTWKRGIIRMKMNMSLRQLVVWSFIMLSLSFADKTDQHRSIQGRPKPNMKVEAIKKRLKTLALLDAIISQELEYRYFSYNSNWGDGEEMASFKNGSGREWFFWTSGNLAAYKAYNPKDGEKVLNYDVILRDCPTQYKQFMIEPAFSMETSSSIWYLENSGWKKYGKTTRDMFELEVVIEWTADNYHKWATEYYEQELSLSAIKNIFQGKISDSEIKALNKDLDKDALKKNRAEIGI